MPDGSRLNVVISPVALDGASISIRKFGKGKKSLADLVEYGSMNEMMANFLVIASRCRINIIVSGGTGSGKTTLLNAMSQYINEDDGYLPWKMLPNCGYSNRTWFAWKREWPDRKTRGW